MNIQPLGDPIDLEERIGGHPAGKLGTAWDGDEAREDMKASLAALEAAVRAGLFARRGEADFLLEFHLEDPADWEEFQSRPRAGPFEADSARLEAALGRRDGRLVVIERTRVTVCDRAG